MPTRTSRVPGSVLLTVPLIGWTAILTVDLVLWLLDQPVRPGLHGVAIGAVVVASGIATTTWSHFALKAQMAREFAGFAGFAKAIMRQLDLMDPTQPRTEVTEALEIDGYLTETAEIYELGRQAGLAQREDGDSGAGV